MEKIKHFIQSDKGKDIMVVLIIILVAFSSFYLGRLSKKGQNEGIKIEYTNKDANLTANALSSNVDDSYQNTSENNTLDQSSIPSGKTYFASSRGQKYYSIHCSAGKTIKQENRIYFDTKQSAEKAGYELSSACK